MPAWADELGKLVPALTTPLMYAAMVFGFFHWLDMKTSGSAKTAISSWINSIHIDKAKGSQVAVEVFDRIYTVPLWGWRAVLRSIFFTTIMTLIVVPQVYSGMWWLWRVVPSDITTEWTVRIIANYTADYAALYVIRRWLMLGGRHPLIASFSGPLIGLVIILLLYTVTDVVRFSLQTQSFHPIYLLQGAWNWILFLGNVHIGSTFALFASALAVHIWLPLFATGVILAQGLNAFLRASGWMQWFLKRGKDHPLDAIGTVAAVVVFVITSTLHALL